jgi:hypothetical protein
MTGDRHPVPISCHIPFELFVTCDSQTIALDAAEGYREVIMSDIAVDRTDRELELNLMREAGELQADVDVFLWYC